MGTPRKVPPSLGTPGVLPLEGSRRQAGRLEQLSLYCLCVATPALGYGLEGFCVWSLGCRDLDPAGFVFGISGYLTLEEAPSATI